MCVGVCERRRKTQTHYFLFWLPTLRPWAWWFLQLRTSLPLPLLIFPLFNPVASLLFCVLLCWMCVRTSETWHECMRVGWWVGASVCESIIDSLNWDTQQSEDRGDAGVREFGWVFKKGRLVWDRDNKIETFLRLWVGFFFFFWNHAMLVIKVMIPLEKKKLTAKSLVLIA